MAFSFPWIYRSDTVKVDQVSSLHPFPVPHGQLHFYLEFYEGEYRTSNPLLIRITSDHLFAFDQYIHNLEFVYYEDETLDSMHVTVDDLPC